MAIFCIKLVPVGLIDVKPPPDATYITSLTKGFGQEEGIAFTFI